MPRTIAKPAGLPVFPPHDDPDGACVLRVLLDEDPWRAVLAWPQGFEGGIAHRLDTSTSGALLVADDPSELARIRDAFGSGRLRKTYRMRASKDVAWDDNACDRPLAHDRRHKKRMIVQRGPSTPHRGAWYPAHTRFHRVEGRLWEVEITTGVMHQIRAHAAFVGLPILGDALYGGGATPDGSPKGVRFFLHHVGLTDGDALHTAPVPLPDWAR